MKTLPSTQSARATLPQSGSVLPRNAAVAPHPPRWFHRLGAWLAWGIEHALIASLSATWEDRAGVFGAGGPVEPKIFCIWHNRLAVAMWLYRFRSRKMRLPSRLAAIVSASKDGAFLAAVLERFHVQPVRGSSSRRGSQALLELTRWAEQGHDLAITPDGPRGPRYVIQDGVIAVAQLTGLPIVPVSCRFSRKWTLKSWDAFQIPKPFAHCEIVCGEVLRVPREANDAERQALRIELETRMRSITKD